MKISKKSLENPEVDPTEGNGQPVLLKNRGIPDRIREGGKPKYPVAEMEVADWLFSRTDKENRNVTVAARAFGKKQTPPRVFKSRKVNDPELGEGYAVIRTE